MDNTEIARIAHEVNRAYCLALGDDSLPPWDEYDRQEMVLQGVSFVLDEPEATPEMAHKSWLAGMEALGWTHGEVKDEAAKTHPNMVADYSELPVDQRAKDSVFIELVKQLAALKQDPVTADGTTGVVAITYIGKRELYSESLYNTGDWMKGQTKLVSQAVASQMLRHPDLYEEGKPEDAAEKVKDEEEDKGDESEELQHARDAVLAMSTKKVVMDFIQSNWANAEKNVNPRDSLPKLQSEAIRLIDLYRLP